MVKVVENYAPTKKTYGGRNPNKTCTIHETANKSTGADAASHGDLQARGNPGRDASWHETVDDEQAVVSFKDTAQCWHAGKQHGNKTSYSIEICVNRDGDYDKAFDNAAQRAADWMERHGHKKASKVLVQDHYWTSKNCPARMRRNKRWNEFVKLVQSKFDGKDTSGTSSSSSSGPTSGLTVDGYWGTETTKRLQQVLGTVVDGEVWSQNIQWKADNPSLTSGWKWVAAADSKPSPVIKALQKQVKTTQDGRIGPNTIKRLQAYLGTVADGKLWEKSPAIKELQKRLNKGEL